MPSVINLYKSVANNKKKILIAEDEPVLMEMYRVYFEKAGFEVLNAENGQVCIELAKKEKPDILLLDVLMPRLNGWDVLKELKSNPETKDMPILVLSNLSQTQEIQKGLALGADDYIIKSDLTPKDLLAKVEKTILKSDSNTAN